MAKGIRGKIRSIYEKFIFHRKLKSMDALWDFYGGSCFELFPPSFYHKHSEEEILRIKEEELAKLKERLKEFAMQNQGKA